MEQDRTISRRAVLTYAGGGAVAFAGIAGASIVLSDRGSATMQVEAENLEVTSPDGTVEEINLMISESRAEYENVDSRPYGFRFITSVNGEEILDHALRSLDIEDIPENDLGQNSGYIQYDSRWRRKGPEIPIFKKSSLEPSDFEVEEEGGSETFDLDVGITFEVYSEEEWSDGTPDLTASNSVTVQLTINNEGVEPTVFIGDDSTIKIKGESQ